MSAYGNATATEVHAAFSRDVAKAYYLSRSDLKATTSLPLLFNALTTANLHLVLNTYLITTALMYAAGAHPLWYRLKVNKRNFYVSIGIQWFFGE